MSILERVVVIALAGLVLLAPRTLAGIGAGATVWRFGLSVSIEPTVIALDGHWTVRERGTGARDRAWAGATSRDDTVAHSLRLAAFPRPVETLHRNYVVARAIGGATLAVARHFARATNHAGTPRTDGVRDADRR